ncbi:hypothetical protein ACQP3L_33760, partial [Escherichia coli]
ASFIGGCLKSWFLSSCLGVLTDPPYSGNLEATGDKRELKCCEAQDNLQLRAPEKALGKGELDIARTGCL